MAFSALGSADCKIEIKSLSFASGIGPGLSCAMVRAANVTIIRTTHHEKYFFLIIMTILVT